MKLHPSHQEILQEIVSGSGKATQHTFLENYLGNKHPRYPVSSPVLRKIARVWASRNKSLSANQFRDVVTSLVHGNTFTEKCIGGILLDYATAEQRKFDIAIFDEWLEQLEGWAEVDSLSTGKLPLIEIPLNFKKWKPLLKELNTSKSIEKRRASLTFYCSPISHSGDAEIAKAALQNIERLQHEREVLITKAISWLLRSMIRHHREKVESYLEENRARLPPIALRETLIKLKTGRKGTSLKKRN